jgi:hypothetical protein
MEHQHEDVDLIKDILSLIAKLRSMLKVEFDYWLSSDNSATSKRIQTFDRALELMEGFVRERDSNACMLVCQKDQICAPSLRRCFYNSGENVKKKRNKALRLFADMCHKLSFLYVVFSVSGALISLVACPVA